MEWIDAISQPVTLPLWMHWVTLAYSTNKLVELADFADRLKSSDDTDDRTPADHPDPSTKRPR